jgi:hypothetical protein
MRIPLESSTFEGLAGGRAAGGGALAACGAEEAAAGPGPPWDLLAGGDGLGDGWAGPALRARGTAASRGRETGAPLPPAAAAVPASSVRLPGGGGAPTGVAGTDGGGGQRRLTGALPRQEPTSGPAGGGSSTPASSGVQSSSRSSQPSSSERTSTTRGASCSAGSPRCAFIQNAAVTNRSRPGKWSATYRSISRAQDPSNQRAAESHRGGAARGRFSTTETAPAQGRTAKARPRAPSSPGTSHNLAVRRGRTAQNRK